MEVTLDEILNHARFTHLMHHIQFSRRPFQVSKIVEGYGRYLVQRSAIYQRD